MDELSQILSGLFEAVRTTPVSEAELAEAKNEILSYALSERETASGRAFELGEWLVSTGNPRAADERLAAISAVTVADVQRVAQTWLRPEGRIDFTYVAGEDDPSTYANPVPLPTFITPPPAVGEPLAVLPEDEREAPPPPGPVPLVERSAFLETQLSNGIQLVATQTGEVPIATITVVLPGGSASDPEGKAGVSGLAAALADKGTETRSAQQIAAELESLGASLGSSEGSDGIYVSLTAPVANLPAAGEVLGDVLRNANYPTEEFERERARLLDGLQISLSDPGALSDMVLLRALYGDSPYGAVPTVESLPNITREDLVAHRESWWHPGATKVVVSGGIAPQAARELVEDMLGDWTSSAAAPQSVADAAGAVQPVRTIVIDMPETGQSAVLMGVRTLTRQDEDYYPLYLANIELGGSSNSRLFEEIRTKRALSYGSYSSLDARADTGLLSAAAQTKHESAAEVAQIILDEFDKLSSAPADEETLEKRRVYVTGSVGRQLETSSGFNGRVASLLQQGIAPEEVNMMAERLAAVSAEDAAQTAARYVSPDRATVVIVGDASLFIDALREVRPDVEVIPVERLNLSGGPLMGPEPAASE